MDPFNEATYSQLERVIAVIDKLKPVELPGTGIPSLSFLERWIEDTLNDDDQPDGKHSSTEWTIQMWERAQPRREN